MHTGRRAFAQASAVETTSAILREEPPEIETLGERFPPALVRLLQHCLEKRPDERFQSARDHRINNLSAARDGKTLTWIDNADESDIWLMTLANPR